MGKQIIVEISPTGEVSIDAQGYKGSGCTKATEQIELVLGGQNKKTKKKPEFFSGAGGSVKNKMTF